MTQPNTTTSASLSNRPLTDVDPEIAAVSAWLGSLPAPSNANPDARNTRRMPMACGSQS